jgi:hypothetical protein
VALNHPLHRPLLRATRYVARCAYLCVASAFLLGCGDTSNASPPADTSVAEDLSDATPAPFDALAFDRVRIGSHSDQPNFQSALAALDWGPGPFSDVVLVIDLGTDCFPFSSWARPPEGHNWPADCDAFDRNFEFTLDPSLAPGDPPGVELVRAITPFGGPLHLEVNLTDVANAMPGPRSLQAHISTWSDSSGIVSGANGGWWVSATLKVTPGAAPRRVLGVASVWNGSFGEDAATGDASFTAPEGTKTTRLEYRATGHGGATDPDTRACIGPAEEFCQREHTLSLDGKPFFSFTPWRDDCDTLCTLADQPRGDGTSFSYCQENPCGAISSVRAPRANWCPGSVTPPLTRFLDGVTPGQPQRLGYAINQLYPGGSWRSSALLLFYAD